GAVRQLEVVGLTAVAAEQTLHRSGSVIRSERDRPVEPAALIGDDNGLACVPGQLPGVGGKLRERSSREALWGADLQFRVRRAVEIDRIGAAGGEGHAF